MAVLGLDCREGDFAHNLTKMLRESYNGAVHFAPEITGPIYDSDNRQFANANASTGERPSLRARTGRPSRIRTSTTEAIAQPPTEATVA